MHLIVRTIGAAVALIACVSIAAPAGAGFVYVEGIVGIDGPNCGTVNPFNPCKTLQKGVDRAAPGDLVYLGAPANYGPATITKTVSILGQVGDGIFSPNKPCITVSAGAKDVVSISQLICDQGGGAHNGIQFNTGKSLLLQNMVIRAGGGTACGVLFQPSGASTFSIQQAAITKFGNTGGGGVCIAPRGTRDVGGVLDDVALHANRIGLSSTAGTGSIRIAVSNGDVQQSSSSGIRSAGATSSIYVTNSTISQNKVGLSHANGKLISVGGNILIGNVTKGTFTATQAPK
jgi:hypothetical protein